jgi:hypothetical protein
MEMFVRVTLAVAAGLVALAVLVFLLKMLVVAAIIAGVVVALAFVVRRFRGAGLSRMGRFG